MLSAVAARKAAQLAAAAQADFSKPDVTTETKRDSIDEQISSQSPLNDSDSAVDGRKRRASGPVTDSPGQKETRKRRKGSQIPHRADSGRSKNGLSEDISGDAEGLRAKNKPSRRRKKEKRYFEGEANLATPISQKESNSHRSEENGSSSDDELFGLPLLPSSANPSNEIPLTPKPPSGRIQRAWSPSNPLRDSSSSDDEPITKPAELLPSSAPPILASPLSDWMPTQDNCYDLPATSSAPSKLFLLQPEGTITLLGVFAFTVLKGGIEYQGIQLSPSPQTIEVFAPRCAPLSALQAIPLDHHRPDKIVNWEELLPAEFRDRVASHNGSALLVSSLRTGIEGLGKVCHTFEDAFSPPRVYGGVVPLGLDGVAMV
jgi:polynucleotide 5'-hydroxyl-kinase GRC3/NOL9